MIPRISSWVSREGLRVGDSGHDALDGKRLTARLLQPAHAVLTVMDAAPLPASPHPKGQAANPGVRKLAVHLTNATQATIVIQLTPQTGAADTPPPLAGQPLDSW